METEDQEADVDRIRRCSLKLLNNRQEVGQRANWFERRSVTRPEGSTAGSEDEGCLDNVQRRLLCAELFGKALIVAAGAIRGMRELDVAVEDIGNKGAGIARSARGGAGGDHDCLCSGSLAASALDREGFEIELLVDVWKLASGSRGEQLVAHVGDDAEVSRGMIGERGHHLGCHELGVPGLGENVLEPIEQVAGWKVVESETDADTACHG